MKEELLPTFEIKKLESEKLRRALSGALFADIMMNNSIAVIGNRTLKALKYIFISLIWAAVLTTFSYYSDSQLWIVIPGSVTVIFCAIVMMMQSIETPEITHSENKDSSISSNLFFIILVILALPAMLLHGYLEWVNAQNTEAKLISRDPRSGYFLDLRRMVGIWNDVAARINLTYSAMDFDEKYCKTQAAIREKVQVFRAHEQALRELLDHAAAQADKQPEIGCRGLCYIDDEEGQREKMEQLREVFQNDVNLLVDFVQSVL